MVIGIILVVLSVAIVGWFKIPFSPLKKEFERDVKKLFFEDEE